MRRSITALIGLVLIGCSSDEPATSASPASVVIDDRTETIAENAGLLESSIMRS